MLSYIWSKYDDSLAHGGAGMQRGPEKPGNVIPNIQQLASHCCTSGLDNLCAQELPATCTTGDSD